MDSTPLADGIEHARVDELIGYYNEINSLIKFYESSIATAVARDAFLHPDKPSFNLDDVLLGSATWITQDADAYEERELLKIYPSLLEPYRSPSSQDALAKLAVALEQLDAIEHTVLRPENCYIALAYITEVSNMGQLGIVDWYVMLSMAKTVVLGELAKEVSFTGDTDFEKPYYHFIAALDSPTGKILHELVINADNCSYGQQVSSSIPLSVDSSGTLFLDQIRGDGTMSEQDIRSFYETARLHGDQYVNSYRVTAPQQLSLLSLADQMRLIAYTTQVFADAVQGIKIPSFNLNEDIAEMMAHETSLAELAEAERPRFLAAVERAKAQIKADEGN